MGLLLASSMFKTPLPFGPFMALLEQSPLGQEMVGAMFSSATRVIFDLFEHEKVRMRFMKWISEGMMHPDVRETGVGLYVMTAVAHTQEEIAVVGGSQALSDALAARIIHHGGSVRSNATAATRGSGYRRNAGEGAPDTGRSTRRVFASVRLPALVVCPDFPSMRMTIEQVLTR